MGKERLTLDKVFNRKWLYFALVVFTAGLLLASDLSHIDDVAYNVVKEKNIIRTTEMIDSESEYDRTDKESLIIEPGKGIKEFTGEIDLKQADVIEISFTAVNSGNKKALVYVDLYGGTDFDDPYDEFSVKIRKGEEKEISQQIAYYRDKHPDKCLLRVFTDSETEVQIKDFRVDSMVVVKDGNTSLTSAAAIMRIIALMSLIYTTAYALYKTLFKKNKTGSVLKKEGALQSCILYSAVILGVTMFLIALYGKIDLSYPLIYEGGDEVGVYYYSKLIAENGLSLTNPFVGGISGADMFDYPYSDKLSFLIVKVISLFSKDPYKTTNLFYFFNFYAIAVVATIVSRKLAVSRINSGIVGILYAFSPYIQMRYGHMWLVPYFMIPVACYLSIGIIKGKIPGEYDKNKRKDLFWTGMILSFMCAFTGMYYAYFACAIIAAAMAIRITRINERNLLSEVYPLGYISSTILGVVINVVPNLVYWHINGTNPYSELLKRNNGDAEVYGLKLVQMILPRTGHRIDFFRRITGGYNNHNPLIDENITAALGIIAAAALVLSLFMLFSRSEKYKEISYLNVATFIIATIGGVGSVISVAVNIPMRCYNRMSLVIMFISLLFVGYLLDELKCRCKPAIAVFVSVCIMLVGVYDQTVQVGPNKSDSLISAKELMQQIDDEMDDGDMIFTLPYDDWPSSTVYGSYGQYIGYIETEGLHWSYGAMQGREEAKWQANVAECDSVIMIEKLKYAGYDGIYLDSNLYERKFGTEAKDAEIDSITKTVGTVPLVSSDDSKCFWKF